MLQTNIVLITGGLTGLVGLVANAKYFGLKQSAIFLALMTMLVYFTYYQVRCLVTGACIFTSWLSTAVAICTFMGIGTIYYYAIVQKNDKLRNTQLLDANPWFSRTASFIKTNYDINLID